VMSPAKHDEVVRFVRSALGAWLQVMHIHERGVPTARHDAAAAITAQDRSPYTRRYVLRCPRRFGTAAHVG
jgi:hypothetical protein